MGRMTMMMSMHRSREIIGIGGEPAKGKNPRDLRADAGGQVWTNRWGGASEGVL